MEILNDLKEFFKTCFVANSEIEDEVVSEEEYATLTGLDYEDVFLNFKSLVADLLKFKENMVRCEKAELVAQITKFEEMAQKLEKEARAHRKYEQELKLELENANVRAEQSEHQVNVLSLKLAKLKKQTQRNSHCTDKKNLSLSHNKSGIENRLRQLEEKYKSEISRITSLHINESKEIVHCRATSQKQNQGNKNLNTGKTLSRTRKSVSILTERYRRGNETLPIVKNSASGHSLRKEMRKKTKNTNI